MNHRWVTLNGWLTYCHWCRVARLRTTIARRRARQACPKARTE
jgi:hypothetical protein